jgi:hypothetical protein
MDVSFIQVYAGLWVLFMVVWFVFLIRDADRGVGLSFAVYVGNGVSGVVIGLRHWMGAVELPVKAAMLPFVAVLEVAGVFCMGLLYAELHADHAEFTDVVWVGLVLKMAGAVAAVVLNGLV